MDPAGRSPLHYAAHCAGRALLQELRVMQIGVVVANFTLGLQSLPCPTRFFTSRDEAMSWLLQAPLP
jgi:hypothetical protein